MEDERLNFLLDNIALFGNSSDTKSLQQLLERNNAVDTFLNNASVSTLVVAFQPNGKTNFTCNISELKSLTSNNAEDGETVDLLFLKRNNSVLTPKNMKENIDIHTLKGNPTANLLSSLQGIWCPLLSEETSSEDSESVSSRVKQLLKQLETTLRASVPVTAPTQSDRRRGGGNNQEIVLDNVAEL